MTEERQLQQWAVFDKVRPLFQQKQSRKHFPIQFHLFNLGLAVIPALGLIAFFSVLRQNRAAALRGDSQSELPTKS
eukprot:ANDGO_07607.mRNA.1 hypothetical protein